MRRGWFGESWRHSLAARGVRTGSRRFLASKKKMPEITAEKVRPGRVFPITKRDARKFIERQDPDDVRGLKAIRFVEPREKMQEDAWAQFVRSKREIRVFSQPEEEVTPAVHMMMKEKVLPHELGHHVALVRRNITDEDLSMAEARADAFAAGLDVEDEDVALFAKGRGGRRVFAQRKFGQRRLVDETAENLASFPGALLGTPVAFAEGVLGKFEGAVLNGVGDVPVRSVAPDVLPERGLGSMTMGLLDRVQRDVDVSRGRVSRVGLNDELYGGGFGGSGGVVEGEFGGSFDEGRVDEVREFGIENNI